MARDQLDRDFEGIVKTTYARLKPLGFRRNKRTLRRVRDGVCGLINFQKSVSSTSERIKFTVNVGVAWELMLTSGEDLSKVVESGAHLRARIGSLSPRRWDHWWNIDAGTAVDAMAQEVADEVEKYAVPFLDRYSTPRAIVEAPFSVTALGFNYWEERLLSGFGVTVRPRPDPSGS